MVRRTVFILEVGFKTYCCMHDAHWPNNADVAWTAEQLRDVKEPGDGLLAWVKYNLKQDKQGSCCIV